MNSLDLDAGLAAVVEYVRGRNAAIEQAMAAGRPVDTFDYAALSGAVSALLDAIDARLTPQPEQPAVKAAA